MRCYFLVYELNGKKGNDLTNIDPFRWLIENRGKNSKSDLIVLRWLQVEVPQHAYDGVQSQIGIEYDTGEVEEPEEKIVKGSKDPPRRPRGWALRLEYVDGDGNVFHKGVEQADLKGKRPKTKDE